MEIKCKCPRCQGKRQATMVFAPSGIIRIETGAEDECIHYLEPSPEDMYKLARWAYAAVSPKHSSNCNCTACFPG